MEFRPCIDIHNGKVKQIVGSSLRDEGDAARENFVASKDADFYADYYKKRQLKNGHVILLNPKDSPFYEETKNQAFKALKAYPGGLQIGGGITNQNAAEFIEAGASHVIITSFVFQGGVIHYDRLEHLVKAVGKEKLVLDLSCRKRGDDYYIVTDRWQKFTKEKISKEIMNQLGNYCDEFLIHAVDVEGKASGIEKPLAAFLGDNRVIPITYAGGIGSYQDIEELKQLSRGNVNLTIGSALSLFGGRMELDRVLSIIHGGDKNAFSNDC